MARKKKNPKQLIGFPFVQGINQVPDIKFPKNGLLSDADNAQVLKTGAITKRFGFKGALICSKPTNFTENLSGDPLLNAQAGNCFTDFNAQGVGVYKKEVIAFDGLKAFSLNSNKAPYVARIYPGEEGYDEAPTHFWHDDEEVGVNLDQVIPGREEWIEKGKVLNLALDYEETASNASSTSGNTQVGIAGNLEIYAWAERVLSGEGSGIGYHEFEDATDGINFRIPLADAELIPDWSKYIIKYMIKDRKTGTIIVPETSLTTSENSFDLTGFIESISQSSINLTTSDYNKWIVEQEGALGIGSQLTINTEVTNDAGVTEEWREKTWISNAYFIPSKDYGVITFGRTLFGTTENIANPRVILNRGNQGSNVLYQQPGLRVVSMPLLSFVYIFWQSSGNVYYVHLNMKYERNVNVSDPILYANIDPNYPQFDVDYLQTESDGEMENGGLVSIMNTATNYGTDEEPVYQWQLRRKKPTSATDPTLIDTALNPYLTINKTAKVSNRQTVIAGEEIDGNCVIRVNIKGCVRIESVDEHSEDIPAGEFDPVSSSILIIFPDETSESTLILGYNGTDLTSRPEATMPAVTSEATNTNENITRQYNLNTGFGVSSGNTIYILSELTDGLKTKSVLTGQTDVYRTELISQLSHVKYTYTSYSDEVELTESKALQVGVSVVSDAVMQEIKGSIISEGYRVMMPFWWVTHNVGNPDDGSGITALISSDGGVYSHWGVNRPAVNWYAFAKQYQRNMVDNVYPELASSMLGLQSNWTMPFMVGACQRVNYPSTIPADLTTGDRSPYKAIIGISELGADSKFQDIPWFKPGLFRMNFKPDRPFKNIEVNNVMLVASGMLHTYAGRQFTEHSFLQQPTASQLDDIVDTEENGFDVGNWKYIFLYEDTDVAGNIHYSRPSDEFTFTNDEESNCNFPRFKINTLQLTNRRETSTTDILGLSETDLDYGDPVRAKINVYRSNNDSNYYYLHDSIEMNNGKFSPKYQIIYVDYKPEDHGIDDTELPSIATPLNGTPSFPVPAPLDICKHKDNVLVTTSFGNSLWTSLKIAAGFGTHFPMGQEPFFLKKFTERPTHVASNGLAAFVFTSNNIWHLGGEGPNISGTMRFGDLSNLSKGIGVQANGFASYTPKGIFFSSQTGFYLMASDLQIKNIGAAVEDYINVPVAGEPVVDQVNNQILIPTKEAGISSEVDPDGYSTTPPNQIILVYNYAFNVWTKWTFLNKIESGNHSRFQGQIVGGYSLVEKDIYSKSKNPLPISTLGFLADGLFSYTMKNESDDYAYADFGNDPSYNMDNYNFPLSVTTGWIQWPDSVDNYGRQFRLHKFKILGEFHNKCRLIVKFYRDFNEETYEEFKLELNSEEENTHEPVQGIFKPAVQKCVAVKISVEVYVKGVYDYYDLPYDPDIVNTTNRQGLTLSGIQMEVTPRQVAGTFTHERARVGD